MGCGGGVLLQPESWLEGDGEGMGGEVGRIPKQVLKVGAS